MTIERSAGVVVYRVCGGARQYLLLDYGKYWDLPKGHVEKDETDQAAAIRETTEETGITDLALDPSFCHEIEYFFRDRKGQLIRKTVAFFLGLTEAETVTISDEHVGAEFMPFDQAIKRLKYANAKEVVKLAEKQLVATD
jgi:bis(5'-nucleosidyl)-tetraphosphatase